MRLRLGCLWKWGVLGLWKNEYRSEHLVGIFGNFWEFLSFTLGYNFLEFYSKHWNKGPRGPDTSFHYSYTLSQKIENFELRPSNFFLSKSQISPFFKLTFLQTFYSDLPQTYTILVEKNQLIQPYLLKAGLTPFWCIFAPLKKTNTDLEYRSVFLGIFLSKIFPKISKFLKILIKNSKSHSNFWFWDSNYFFWSEIFDPLFLTSSHGEGTSLSYRDVEKKSETLPIFFRVRFGFVFIEFWPFEKSDYWSEVLISTFGNFFLRFFEIFWTSEIISKNFKKGSQGPQHIILRLKCAHWKNEKFWLWVPTGALFAIFLHWLIKEIFID